MRRSIAIGCVVAGLPGLFQGAAAQTYEVIQLETLGGANAVGLGINDAGQVVGYSGTAQGIDHATVWNGVTPTDLGTMGGTESKALGINSSGAIVGYTTIGGVLHAFLYDGGSVTDIGGLSSSGARARGINDAGQIVGDFAGSGGLWHGFLYSNGTMTDLGTLVGPNSYSAAYAINNTTQIVGYSFNFACVTGACPSPDHAFIWSSGTMTDLGIGGPSDARDQAIAYSINDSGKAVGAINGVGTMWDAGTIISLGQGVPAWINAAGDIVGVAVGGPVIWRSGSTSSTSLKSLIDPTSPYAAATMTHAVAINRDNWIVVTDLSSTANAKTYLLRPQTLAFSSASLSFGNQILGTTSAAKSFTVTNNGHATVAVSQITATGDFVQANNCGSSIAPGNACTIDVTFAPTDVDGRTGQLTVTTASSSYVVAASGVGTITATLTSSAASVTTGTPVTLSWTSSPGSSCLARNGNNSDGWSGPLAASGSKNVVEGSPGISTYGVTCTNGSQSVEAQVSVAYAAPPSASGASGSSGGGGALDLYSALALLGGLALSRARLSCAVVSTSSRLPPAVSA